MSNQAARSHAKKPVRVRRLAPVIALALVAALPAAGLIGADATQVSAANAAPATVAVASTAPVFSSPAWLPFRSNMRISCVFSNCTSNGKPNHGYWAMDFLNPYATLHAATPVYATGGGIAHIGGQHSGCQTAASTIRGNWVWVDHGGGETSLYYHFSRILVSEGQVVTPATRLGLLGSTGDLAPCATPYLHYEFRMGGVQGTRVQPASMGTCIGSSRVTYPAALGYRSWNDIPNLTTASVGSTLACTSNPLRVTSARAVAARARQLAVTVSWSAPATNPQVVNRYVVATRAYHPTIHRWSNWVYKYPSSTTRSLTFGGLHRTTSYQFRVAAHDPHGASGWSPSLTKKV